MLPKLNPFLSPFQSPKRRQVDALDGKLLASIPYGPVHLNLILAENHKPIQLFVISLHAQLVSPMPLLETNNPHIDQWIWKFARVFLAFSLSSVTSHSVGTYPQRFPLKIMTYGVFSVQRAIGLYQHRPKWLCLRSAPWHLSWPKREAVEKYIHDSLAGIIWLFFSIPLRMGLFSAEKKKTTLSALYRFLWLKGYDSPKSSDWFWELQLCHSLPTPWSTKCQPTHSHLRRRQIEWLGHFQFLVKPISFISGLAVSQAMINDDSNHA